MKLFLFLIFTPLLLAAQSSVLFSRVDGTRWTCATDAPWGVLPAAAGPAVGQATNTFGGQEFWIDAVHDALIRDGAVLPLDWYEGRRWDVQPVSGFCIAEGVGWLASQDAAGAESFLLRVNLSSGAVVPIGPLGDYGNFTPVNGLSVIPEPSGAALAILGLGLLGRRRV